MRGGWSGSGSWCRPIQPKGRLCQAGLVATSVDAVVPELLGDVGIDGPGGGEIAVGAALVALLPLRQSAAVKRVRNLRVGVQGRREIVDRQVEFAELEIAEAAAIERDRDRPPSA